MEVNSPTCHAAIPRYLIHGLRPSVRATRAELVSLALVAEDSSREFYVEPVDAWNPEGCMPILQREALPPNRY